MFQGSLLESRPERRVIARQSLGLGLCWSDLMCEKALHMQVFRAAFCEFSGFLSSNVALAQASFKENCVRGMLQMDGWHRACHRVSQVSVLDTASLKTNTRTLIHTFRPWPLNESFALKAHGLPKTLHSCQAPDSKPQNMGWQRQLLQLMIQEEAIRADSAPPPPRMRVTKWPHPSENLNVGHFFLVNCIHSQNLLLHQRLGPQNTLPKDQSSTSELEGSTSKLAKLPQSTQFFSNLHPDLFTSNCIQL